MGRGELREIVLIGGSQCGKSTLFNALVGGRRLSPSGVGLKTSACVITASPISETIAESVELFWRNPGELQEIVDTFDPSKIEDPIDREQCRRIVSLVGRYNGTEELEELRSRTRFDEDQIEELVTYPTDWERRWSGPEDAVFALNEVLFLFIDRVVYNIHNKRLEEAQICISDSPGYDTGIWDATIAREAILYADRVVWVLDGAKSLRESDREHLKWLCQMGLSYNVMFAQNAMVSKDVAKNLAATNEAILREFGVVLLSDSTPVFNARMAFAFANWQKEHSFELKKELARCISTFLDLDLVNDKDRKWIFDCFDRPDDLVELSGFTQFVEVFLKHNRNRDIDLVSIPPITLKRFGIDEDDEYEWVDDSNIVTRLNSGVRQVDKMGIARSGLLACLKGFANEKARSLECAERGVCQNSLSDGLVAAASQSQSSDTSPSNQQQSENTSNQVAIVSPKVVSGTKKGVKVKEGGKVFGIDRFGEKALFLTAATAATAIASIWNPGIGCAAAAMAAREYKSKFG